MNELSKAFRKAMKKHIGTNWKFDCYGYNNYKFTDVKHAPKDDRGKLKDDYHLDDDDVVAYNPRVSHSYLKLTKKWVKDISRG